jgi:hypothetical protein
LNTLSREPQNTVIGLVRNKAATEDAVAREFPGRKNVHLVEADMTNYEALKARLCFIDGITMNSYKILESS